MVGFCVFAPFILFFLRIQHVYFLSFNTILIYLSKKKERKKEIWDLGAFVHNHIS